MLVTNYDQIVEIIPTLEQASGENEEMHIYGSFRDNAELWLKRELLGGALYDELDRVQDEEGNGGIVKLCRQVVALKLYDDSIPFTDLVQTANGFAVVKTDVLTPASKERVEKLRVGVKARMYDAFENLIEHLETDEQWHELWKASKPYKTISRHMVITSREFSMYGQEIDCEGYLKLRPSIIAAQNETLSRVIGAQQLAALLIMRHSSGDLDEENRILIDQVCRLVAAESLSRGLESMSVTVDGSGIVKKYVIGRSSSVDNERLQQLRVALNRRVSELSEMIINWFEDRVESFVLYRDCKERALRLNNDSVNTGGNVLFSGV